MPGPPARTVEVVAPCSSGMASALLSSCKRREEESGGASSDQQLARLRHGQCASPALPSQPHLPLAVDLALDQGNADQASDQGTAGGCSVEGHGTQLGGCREAHLPTKDKGGRPGGIPKQALIHRLVVLDTLSASLGPCGRARIAGAGGLSHGGGLQCCSAHTALTSGQRRPCAPLHPPSG